MARNRPSRTRRRSQYQQPATGAADRARARRREIKPVGQPKSQTGARRERRGGFRGFASESVAELKKVEWPGRRQLVSATVVVIIAVDFFFIMIDCKRLFLAISPMKLGCIPP